MKYLKIKTIIAVIIIISITFLLFCYEINFLKPNFYKNYNCLRLVRNINREEYISQVKSIFYQLAEEKGIPNIISPSNYQNTIRLYAYFLELNIAGLDIEHIKKIMNATIDSELKRLNNSKPIDRLDVIEKELLEDINITLKKAYQKLTEYKENLFEKGISMNLPNYEDFKNKISIDIYSGASTKSKARANYLPFLDRIVINLDIFRDPNVDPASVVVHEALHMLFPGFSNPLLNEGMTTLLTEKVTNTPYKGSYIIPVAIIRKIQDIVGEEALLKAYVTGSYEPLKEKLDERIINIFKKTEIAIRTIPLYHNIIPATMNYISDNMPSLEFYKLENSGEILTAIAWFAYINRDNYILEEIENIINYIYKNRLDCEDEKQAILHSLQEIIDYILEN